MERKLIAAAVSSALVLPMAAQAVEFSVSGHVNRAVLSVDGGGADMPGTDDMYDGDVTHVDSNASETRFRFTGSEELENGMTAGVNLEIGRPSAWRTRHAAAYLSTAGGRITLGQTSAATDGMAHADLGGPSWLGGATNWCSYVSSGPACPSNDGGRPDVLRYDTPAIGPASIAVSTGNDDYFDIKLSVAGSMGDAGYDFRIGHIAEYEADVAAVPTTVVVGPVDPMPGDPVTVLAVIPGTPAGTEDVGDITTMSGAVSFGQGTSVAAAWSQQDTGDQVEYTYMKLDHSYGDGSIGVYYKQGEYGAGMKDGVEGSLWGIAVGHSLGGGATAYAGYRQISEDHMRDIDVLLAGLRVTFN